MRKSFLRPSPALIVALIALFVAMGGVGYAAVKLKKNAVKTKNIKNHAVTTDKLADGAVTTSKIGASQVAGTDLGTIVTRVTTTPLPDDGTLARAVAACGAGEKLIGGGDNVGNVGGDITIQGSRPSNADASVPNDGDSFSSWESSAINAPGGATGATTIKAWAVCLK